MTTTEERGYWQDVDRQIKISNYYERRAARETNAEFLLINVVPFGTERAS